MTTLALILSLLFGIPAPSTDPAPTCPSIIID